MAKKTSAKKADRGTSAAKMVIDTSTTATATTEEFQNIALDLIIVEKQIRTDVSVDGEDAQGFVDSVAAKGVIEPIVVTPREEKFLSVKAG